MAQTPLVGFFVATVTWIPILTRTSAERGVVLDHKMPSPTAPAEVCIPLH